MYVSILFFWCKRKVYNFKFDAVAVTMIGMFLGLPQFIAYGINF